MRVRCRCRVNSDPRVLPCMPMGSIGSFERLAQLVQRALGRQVGLSLDVGRPQTFADGVARDRHIERPQRRRPREHRAVANERLRLVGNAD